MDGPDRFRINAPDVINQTIDGEAIVLHLGTGRYYSARGSGARAWDLLSQAVSTSDVAACLAAEYDAVPGDVACSIEDFSAYLIQQSLVVPAEPGATASVPASADVPASSASDRPPFEPPVMESFSDLEDLLLLDPVHEVDSEKGWPHPEALA